MAEVDARIVGPDEYPALHERVQRLAQLADLTPPRMPSRTPTYRTVSLSGRLAARRWSSARGSSRRSTATNLMPCWPTNSCTSPTATRPYDMAGFASVLTNGEYDPLADLLPGMSRYALGLVALGLAYVFSARVLAAPFGSLSFTLGFLFLFAVTSCWAASRWVCSLLPSSSSDGRSHALGSLLPTGARPS